MTVNLGGREENYGVEAALKKRKRKKNRTKEKISKMVSGVAPILIKE